MTERSQPITNLVDAVDALLEAVRAYGRPPADYDPLSDPDGGARLYPTAEEWTPLRELHARVIGLAAAGALPAPPPLEAAGLPLYVRIPWPVFERDEDNPDKLRSKQGAVYQMERIPNSAAAEKWQAQLQDLRTAAQAWLDAQSARQPMPQSAGPAKKMTVAPSHHAPVASLAPADGTVADPCLSERQYDILEALFLLKAFHSASRQNTSEIARRAEGLDANPEAFKDPIADLKRRQLIATKTGRGGGCWLTAEGRKLIEQVRKPTHR